jgi:FAD/FMN-containing dehydrogenase/Fe-S oxidoreductase
MQAVQDFLHALRTDLRGEAHADPITRSLYATDASNYQIEPLAVVKPRDKDDVVATVKHAAAFGLPVLPRGGGTSLAGSTVGRAVILDMSKYMRQVIGVDAEAKRARVQPGVPLQVLNNQLAAHGLKFGPDPASAVVCTLGGMIGNNSTGSHSILYRMTADNLHATDVVLSDGTFTRFEPTPRSDIGNKIIQAQATSPLEAMIWQSVPVMIERARPALDARRPDTWRRCGGYNLDRLLSNASTVQSAQSALSGREMINFAELICGSEGTLAILTEAELKLVSLPKQTALVLVAFDDLNASLEAVPHILEAEPSAVEQLDRYTMQMQREAGGEYSIARFIGADDPDSVLITEFYGASDAELQAKIGKLQTILSRTCSRFRTYAFTDAPSQNAVWQMRKAQAGLMMRQRSAWKPVNLIEDVAVPVQHLAAYIRDICQVADELGLTMTMGAHASAGCLHVSPFVNLKEQGDVFKMRKLAEATAELVLNYKGALSSEHGDGLARSWLNRHVFGEEIYNTFKQVKRAFDPQNLMNPGKIVDGPPMEDNLRLGPTYKPSNLQTQTVFNWSADGGIVNAIEQCSGVGYCRKVDSGTLCPSYKVTLDERDTTRGRANALRNALSGRLPRETLYSDEMRDVLDLCVGCKACQSECPSSIDMARIKSEWQHQYHQQHGLSLGEWLFANMPRIGEWLSHAPPLAKFANGLLEAELFAAPIKKLLGVAQERNLPKFAEKRLEIGDWGLTKSQSPISNLQSPVVLYLDTWSRHHYPHMAQAAFEVLCAAGFDVIVPKYVCCGRTYISKGMLDDAREAADAVVESLSEFVARGIPIVGLEPSCILSFRDEYPTLSSHSHRHSLAQLALTFEEFVAKHSSQFETALQHHSITPVLLHGHCHQKAQVGTKPAHIALQLAGYAVTEVDSGCCGMAGSFGYEANHYAISKQMAERVLIPAVRGVNSDTPIVAAGVSCRQQIKDLSGRTALHPAEALRLRLG